MEGDCSGVAAAIELSRAGRARLEFARSASAAAQSRRSSSTRLLPHALRPVFTFHAEGGGQTVVNARGTVDRGRPDEPTKSPTLRAVLRAWPARPSCRDEIPFLFVQPQRFLGLGGHAPRSCALQVAAPRRGPDGRCCHAAGRGVPSSRRARPPRGRAQQAFARLRGRAPSRTERQRYCDMRSSGAAARSPSFV